MPRTLCIKNKIFSLKGKMFITDEHEKIIYEADGELAFIAPKWRINKGSSEVASVQRKIFSWVPTWLVSSSFGEFVIKRKVWSWRRCYTILGGPFSGSVVRGNIWDLQFEIEHNGRQVARAEGKMFSLRDEYAIEVLDNDEKSELLTVIIMVALQLDRRSESSNTSSSNSH